MSACKAACDGAEPSNTRSAVASEVLAAAPPPPPADVFDDAFAEHDRLHQRIAGEAVCAVHAGARDLAAGVKARQRRAPELSVRTPPMK